jgi:NTE family protein
MGSPYEFSQTGELIARGAASTDAWLANGGLERREIPGQLNAHKHDK